MLFRKQPCDSSGTHHPQSGQDQSESLRTAPTHFNFLAPSQERWRSTEFRRARVPGRQESQISHDSGTLLNHKRGITRGTRSSAAVSGKTHIEALQFLTTCGATPPQTLTSFRQKLCDEILGPTFLCFRFTTSARLGFLQTQDSRLQEGFGVGGIIHTISQSFGT